MAMLSGVVSGASSNGARIVLAGPEKVGKTTLACDAPNSLLVPMEDGYATVRTARLPKKLETWEEVKTLCLELIDGAKRNVIKRGTSIVWDSGTALERLIHAYVLRKDPQFKPGNPNGVTMESALGGFGKAYNVANEVFNEWCGYQDQLAQFGGINCIITCHVFASLMIDPAAGEYHSWDLQLHSPKNQKTYGKREIITQWADMIGFLHEPMFVMKGEKGQILSKGISSGQGRQLAVERTPSWVAGNRFGLKGLVGIPDPMSNPPSGIWNALALPIYNSCGLDIFNKNYAPPQ